MNTRAIVASVGARTALGLTAPQTAFLLRTGVTAIHAAPLVDSQGEPITMCWLPTVDPRCTGEARAARLAEPALAEVYAGLGPSARALSTRLVVCLGEQYAEKGDRDAAARGADLAGRVHLAAREIVPGCELDVSVRGAAGAAIALARALTAMAERRVDAVLLAGVHTDYDPAAIARLEGQGRLFTPRNLDALIPGEAAAFALLVREDVARAAKLPALARVVGVGTGVDRATPDNDEPAFDARGLTAAVRAAGADLTAEQLKVGWSWNDLTFEMRRTYEWQAMVTRTGGLWGEPYATEWPAQRLGHLGAAALPLHVALACEGWRRGWAPSSIAISLVGSDGGDRGAVALVA
jgi:3-oxoacyl-[acyl-carrier-protein] synthase-1